jgi:hypothetical protein
MNTPIIRTSIIAIAALGLGACTFTKNQNHWIKREVTGTKLANGKSLHLGFKAPSAANHCKLKGSESHNWSGERFKNMFKMSGGASGLKDLAVKYANSHPKQHINYCFLYIPNQDSVMGINVTMMRKATNRYYSCKNPPALHSNPFKA